MNRVYVAMSSALVSLLLLAGGCGGSGSSCPVGQIDCGGVCVDSSSDRNNCGGCGITCLSGQTCQNSTCVACQNECTEGQKRCSSGSNDTFEVCGDPDGDTCKEWGPPQACPSGQICQDDGSCIADPDANRVTGTFNLTMGSSQMGSAEVTGKLDGKGLFMNLGGQVEFQMQIGVVHMELYGILTNNLLNALVLQLPTDPPIDQPVRFGQGGAARGTFDLVELDNDGYETGRTTQADIVGGEIVFSNFSLSNGQRVSGTLDVELLSR